MLGALYLSRTSWAPLGWVIGAAGSFSLIAARLHYTMDGVVGLIIGALVFNWLREPIRVPLSAKVGVPSTPGVSLFVLL